MMIQKSLSGLWWKCQHQQLCLCRKLKKYHGSTIVIDYYSRYFEVHILKSVTYATVIGGLERIFCTHNLPQSLKQIMDYNSRPRNLEDF